MAIKMRALLSLSLFPFLAALGHDLYINFYVDKDNLRALKSLRPEVDNFMISDFGWVWNEYAPNSLQALRDSFAQGTWDNIINPILQMPTMLVAIIPFLIVAAIGIILYIVRGGISLGNRSKLNKNSVYKHEKANHIHFKKK